MLSPRLPESATQDAEVLARGTPACPGVASGVVVADSDAAEAAGGDVVLARPTTSPEDVAGMIAARAVVTERGGSTSHAAVVTRALGCPSVVGVGEDATSGWAGREVTVDGTSGIVYAGLLPTSVAHIADVPGLDQLVAWATDRSDVRVVEAAEDVLDLDEVGLRLDPDQKPDVDALVERMRGAAAVRGSVLGSAEGARAVLGSGVPAVVPTAGQRPETLILRLAQAREART